MSQTLEPDAGTSDNESPAGLTHRQILTIFCGLMLGMALAAIDQTVVSTALPTIVGDLGGIDHLAWVVTAYLLAETIVTPIYGKLGDLYGRKKVLQSAIVIFLIGSVLSGVANSMAMLIVFRFVQGLGGGGLIVVSSAAIADIVGPRERGRYQGYFGAVFGVTTIAGPLLGGFLTDHLSWRWVFYINVPLGIAALVVTSIVLPDRAATRTDRTIDWTGAAMLTGAISCFILATTWGGNEFEWGSAVMIGLGVAVVLFLAGFVTTERRVPEPMLPLRLFRMRTFVIAITVSFTIGMAMYGATSYLPTFMQIVNGASASNSGLLLTPMMLSVLASSIVAGQIATRTGHYRILPTIGMGLLPIGIWILSTMNEDSGRIHSTFGMLVMGTGIGLTMQMLVLATQNEAPARDLGVATSSVMFFRTIGGSLGVAAFGAMFTSRLGDMLGGEFDISSLSPQAVRALPDEERATVMHAFAESITSVFAWAVPFAVLGFVATWFLRGRALSTAAGEERRAAAGH